MSMYLSNGGDASLDEPLCFRPARGTERAMRELGLDRSIWLRDVVNKALRREIKRRQHAEDGERKG